MGQGARALVLGLDGASWNLVDRFIAEGALPNLEALCDQGLRSPLNSTMPPMTLPSWSSMLTGTNPGKHGIFDFVHRRRPSWELEFVNSSHRAVPTLHQLLSEDGARVASLCVPTTWPPDPVDGVVISGFDSPVSTGIDASHCSSEGLFKELRARFGGVHFADFNECRIDKDWHARARRSLLDEIPRKEAIARWLLSRERWDLMMLLWGEIDTACHHFWAICDPESPRHCPARSRGLEDTIREVYRSIDQSVGRLLDAARPDLVCVCSDHGFGGASAHVLYLNHFLEQHGWLRSAEARRSSSARLLDSARSAVARHIPHERQGALFRALPNVLLGRTETASRLGRVDIPDSRAFSDEMNYAVTLRLNLPKSQHREAVEELGECLGDWSVDGEPVVEALHYRDDLYWGDCVERSPEVIVELREREGYSYTLLPSRPDNAGRTWEKLEGDSLVGAKGSGMSGSHRQHGVLIFSGQDVPNIRLEETQMWDIAPSILRGLGAPVPAHMDGAELWGDPELHRNLWPSSDSSDRYELSRGRQRALEQRLQRLGYL